MAELKKISMDGEKIAMGRETWKRVMKAMMYLQGLEPKNTTMLI